MEINEEQLYRLIGERIKKRRSQIGITQKALSKYIGLSRTSVTNIEAGIQKVPLDTIYQICLFLNLNIRDLLPSVEEISTETKEQVNLEGLSDEATQFLQDVWDSLPEDDES